MRVSLDTLSTPLVSVWGLNDYYSTGNYLIIVNSPVNLWTGMKCSRAK